jgi:DNA-binding GntR family transcriptional regulator
MSENVTTQVLDPRSSRAPQAPDARSRISLTDDVYSALKWRILTLDLRPGALYREEDLCRLVGYGRSPVHQALHRLKYDGLVEIIPRKGIIVRAYSAQDINDLIETRLPIEMEMARLAARRATQSRIEQLRRRLAEGRAFLTGGDREALMALDRDFHRGIAECTGNKVLIDMLENLHQRSMILWFVTVSSDGRQYDIVQEEHEHVLECIATGDAEAAAEAMRRHLEPFLRR